MPSKNGRLEVATTNNENNKFNNILDEQCSPLQNSGITLIALIITIILLLILAGVTIHFTLGENGILKNASIAGEKYEEANAKEQLTLELASIQTKTYKETGKKATLEDVKNLINKDKYDVTIEEGGSSATIEDLEKEYTFIVEENLTIQDVEKITNLDKTIKIETSATNKRDYTTSTLKAKITLTEEIASIKIGQVEIEIPAKTEENGKNIYEIEKEVEKNGNYKIKVETVSGNTNYKIQQVKDLSEDIEIYTAFDLVKFRDRVCQGATYEGKTIKVMNDIDLSTVCGNNVNGKEVSWKPIGYKTVDLENEEDDYIFFKGTFDGQYKTISNLYINTHEYIYVGLFSLSSGTIKNLLMNNVYIYIDSSESVYAADRSYSIGALAAQNHGLIENIGINSGNITSINTATANDLIHKYRVQEVGGITAACYNEGKIKKCYNKANISLTNTSKTNTTTNTHNIAGGIVGGCDVANIYVENCYNTGKIEIKDAYINNAGGIIGRVLNGTYVTSNYNYGKIIATNGQSMNACGGLIGWNSNKAILTNSHYTETSTPYSYWNGSSFTTTGKVTEDTLKGYASTLNEKDGEGNEIEVWVQDATGINNGYPILKWQIQK